MWQNGFRTPNLPYLSSPLIHLALNSRTEMWNGATSLVFKQHLLEFPLKKMWKSAKIRNLLCHRLIWELTKCAWIAFCGAFVSGLETTCVILSALKLFEIITHIPWIYIHNRNNPSNLFHDPSAKAAFTKNDTRLSLDWMRFQTK